MNVVQSIWNLSKQFDWNKHWRTAGGLDEDNLLKNPRPSSTAQEQEQFATAISTSLPPASAVLVLISANPESSLHRQIPKAHVLVHLSWAPPLTKTSELHQRHALGLVGWLVN